MQRNYIVAEPLYGKYEEIIGARRVRGNYQTYAKALAAKARINRERSSPDRAVVIMRIMDPSRFNYSHVHNRHWR